MPKGVPPVSTPGAPQLTQLGAEVYFGVGQTGYVVADSRQREVDYSTANGGVQESRYPGTGGISIGSFWTKAAFALRFHSLNLLISSDITSKSRLMFFQDVRARVAKVAPFLTVDNNPYPVIDHGQIYWIVDAYTTTSYYPYAQQVNTAQLPGGGLANASFNYVRNSVKVVVNAYTGDMTFYATTRKDPILNTWESIFPNMFKPLAEMDGVLRSHLRYPQALLMLQASVFGRYHLTNPSSWYIANNAWELAPTSGTGSPDSPLPTDAYGNTLRFVPEYEILQLPGASQTGFTVIEPLDPLSQGDRLQTLSALMTADCSYEDYGNLTAYVTPPENQTVGPAVVNSRIQSNTVVSQYVTLLGRAGSTVSLGTTLIIPIDDSLVYVRPLYVSSSANAYPQLTRYIVVYGNQVSMGATLGIALSDVFGAVTGNIGGGTGAIPATVRALIAERAELLRAGSGGTQERRPHDLFEGHDDRGQPALPGGGGPQEGRQVRLVCLGQSFCHADGQDGGRSRLAAQDYTTPRIQPSSLAIGPAASNRSARAPARSRSRSIEARLRTCASSLTPPPLPPAIVGHISAWTTAGPPSGRSRRERFEGPDSAVRRECRVVSQACQDRDARECLGADRPVPEQLPDRLRGAAGTRWPDALSRAAPRGQARASRPAPFLWALAPRRSRDRAGAPRTPDGPWCR